MDGVAGALPLTETQYLIMASLIEPAHGYAIMQQVDEITDGRVVIGPGTMYGTLKKLLKRKLILQVEGPSGNERRITYSLTADGRRLLESEIGRLAMLARIGEGKLLELRRGIDE